MKDEEKKSSSASVTHLLINQTGMCLLEGNILPSLMEIPLLFLG